MNPFDLHGGAFLLFYLTLIAVVWMVVVYLRRTLGPAGLPAKRLTEPYIIALLRGGTNEATYLATLSLIRRGLLQCNGRYLKAVDGAADQVSEPVELAILANCVHLVEGHLLLTSFRVKNAWRERRQQLKMLQLIPDAGLSTRHRAIALGGMAVLLLVAGIKLGIALSTGHSNVGFLLVLGLISGITGIVQAIKLPTITPSGREVLAELQTLFSPLRSHPVSNRSEEAMFLGAVFGITALPYSERNLMTGAFAPPPQTSGSGDGSSGSGCGSSGGSSCGGCGGGGCGG
jgi:uncharacterized protein (TIGR04222 family)